MGVMLFLVKNCWPLRVVWAGTLVNYSSWNGQKYLKSLKEKISPKPNTASHNSASWYTGTDGFLEHSPSRGSLYYKGPAHQKIILVFCWGRGSYLIFSQLLDCFYSCANMGNPAWSTPLHSWCTCDTNYWNCKSGIAKSECVFYIYFICMPF